MIRQRLVEPTSTPAAGNWVPNALGSDQQGRLKKYLFAFEEVTEDADEDWQVGVVMYTEAFVGLPASGTGAERSMPTVGQAPQPVWHWCKLHGVDGALGIACNLVKKHTQHLQDVKSYVSDGGVELVATVRGDFGAVMEADAAITREWVQRAAFGYELFTFQFEAI